MAQAVTMWRAEDGSIHATEVAALRADVAHLRRQLEEHTRARCEGAGKMVLKGGAGGYDPATATLTGGTGGPARAP